MGDFLRDFNPKESLPNSALERIVNHKKYVSAWLIHVPLLPQGMKWDASKNGVAQEAVQNIKRASKTMTEGEARQILGVTENSSWEEIVQKYDNLFERNAKNGSFYLQSKIHRAKECLEAVYQPKEPEKK
ncbi:mitochondrial import inner membrane translocase subunit PAM16 like 2 isoform X1 [Nicotiana tabacum]|uniref:Mitochondrial import inner membrane translocase subunit PAM16 like 2 isoform X1 n=3 Tax=Nicotiana tabacum TaxID=4097 RepID=A0A1S4AM89_TOBAC|nr:mitochondrial import inner membrane translocase subunit PAM16 like 2-like isoform X1 [Nicotiana tomentosiformis]XP_016477759.1 PREDICTED: mitochondrial import inner membrane translocase subunit TIM16-like [Nicotiana tabacum]XP_033509648.1 mitochondrial import inner membrane translocase subunit PAM16 like 2-like isoform X1 [Nicotiana tomentosiformis]